MRGTGPSRGSRGLTEASGSAEVDEPVGPAQGQARISRNFTCRSSTDSVAGPACRGHSGPPGNRCHSDSTVSLAGVTTGPSISARPWGEAPGPDHTKRPRSVGEPVIPWCLNPTPPQGHWARERFPTIRKSTSNPVKHQTGFLLFSAVCWAFSSASFLPLCAVMCLVTPPCLTLYGPTDCSPPGSSVHGMLQARTLEWAVMPSSRGSSRPRD